jgi:tetratricopeptide (TPR) repeat protein
MDDLVVRDPANRNYALLRAELEGRVANSLADANRTQEALTYAEPSIAYFRKLGDSPDATPQQLISAIRSLAECGIESLRDYPAALRYALRANELAQGKDPAALGFLAEVYGLQRDFPKAIEAAERGLAATPSKPGDPPTRLQKWLRDQISEYKAKSRN